MLERMNETVSNDAAYLEAKKRQYEAEARDAKERKEGWPVVVNVTEDGISKPYYRSEE